MTAKTLDIDCTGYADGDRFTSPEEVREYFTVDNMNWMFGEPADGEQRPRQDQLEVWADAVILTRSHMVG